jgi:hypothetical protein
MAQGEVHFRPPVKNNVPKLRFHLLPAQIVFFGAAGLDWNESKFNLLPQLQIGFIPI